MEQNFSESDDFFFLEEETPEEKIEIENKKEEKRKLSELIDKVMKQIGYTEEPSEVCSKCEFAKKHVESTCHGCGKDYSSFVCTFVTEVELFVSAEGRCKNFKMI